jgi:protein-tyrosine phosphatase
MKTEFLYWIIPNQLAGRPGPNRQPWSITELRADGFTLVVSLTERLVNRSFEFAAHGLDHISIPLPKNAPPRPGDAFEIGALLPHIYEIVQQRLTASPEERILVHCSSGKDRTGLFMTYFLMRSQQLPMEDAFSQVRALRPDLLTASGWDEMARQVLPHLPLD